jgi:hypothetical protein
MTSRVCASSAEGEEFYQNCWGGVRSTPRRPRPLGAVRGIRGDVCLVGEGAFGIGCLFPAGREDVPNRQENTGKQAEPDHF